MIHSLFPTTVYNIQIANTMRLELLDACNSVLTDVGEDHLLNIEVKNQQPVELFILKKAGFY